MIEAFITGSRAYGIPTSESDIDLVVRVSSSVADELRKVSEDKDTIRFGRLNLIVCETDTEFAIWKIGTAKMLQQKREFKYKFSREKAKKLLDEVRDWVGIKDEYVGGK